MLVSTQRIMKGSHARRTSRLKEERGWLLQGNEAEKRMSRGPRDGLRDGKFQVKHDQRNFRCCRLEQVEKRFVAIPPILCTGHWLQTLSVVLYMFVKHRFVVVRGKLSCVCPVYPMFA